MPKKNNKRNPGLFSCITAQVEKEEMVISAPIQSLEEKRLINEIFEKIPVLEKREKTIEERQLLSLMGLIKDFSLKKSALEIEKLNKMIAIYAEKKIDWSQYENTMKTTMDEVMMPSPIPIAPPLPSQQTQKSFLSKEQLQNHSLNKVPQDLKRTEQPDHQVMLNCELEKIFLGETKGLKSVNLNRVTFSERTKSSPNEFQIRLAELKARRKEKNNTSTQEISTMNLGIASDPSLIDEVYSDKAKQLLETLRSCLESEEFTLAEIRLKIKICSEKEFDEQDFQEFAQYAEEIKNNYFYSKIYPILQNLKNCLSEEEYNVINNEITVKSSNKQLGNQDFQRLYLYTKKITSSSSFNALSMLLEEDEGNRSRIVSMVDVGSSKEADGMISSNQEPKFDLNHPEDQSLDEVLAEFQRVADSVKIEKPEEESDAVRSSSLLEFERLEQEQEEAVVVKKTPPPVLPKPDKKNENSTMTTEQSNFFCQPVKRSLSEPCAPVIVIELLKKQI